MARKHSLPPHDMFTDADMSVNLVSDPTNVSQIDQGVILLDFTGTPDGEFELEGAQVKSKDMRANSPLPASTEWTALEFGDAILAEGASDSHQIVFTSMPFTHIRLKFTNTGLPFGTNVLNATISGKSVGA